jgi:hypothetical protein
MEAPLNDGGFFRARILARFTTSSIEADFHVFAKLGENGLERSLETEITSTCHLVARISWAGVLRRVA